MPPRRQRSRELDEMSAAEAWPRLAIATAVMFVGAGYVLLQPRPSNPAYAVLYDMLRPVGFTTLAFALVVGAITAFVWRRAQANRVAFRRTGFTPTDLRRLSAGQFE